MNILTYIWLAVHGVAFIFTLTRWLPDARFLKKHISIKRVADGHLYGAYATLAMTGGYFAVGLLGLVSTAVSSLITPLVLVAGSLIGLLPAYYFYKQLGDDALVQEHSSRWQLVHVAAAVISMAALVGWALWSLRPAAFEYAAAEMPMVNSELCPGDPIMVEISGTTDGRARTSTISGLVYRGDDATDVVTVYEPYSRDSSGGEPRFLSFIYDGRVYGRFVPENVQPGERLTYQHSVRDASGGAPASFISRFTIAEDCN